MRARIMTVSRVAVAEPARARNAAPAPPASGCGQRQANAACPAATAGADRREGNRCPCSSDGPRGAAVTGRPVRCPFWCPLPCPWGAAGVRREVACLDGSLRPVIQPPVRCATLASRARYLGDALEIGPVVRNDGERIVHVYVQRNPESCGGYPDCRCLGCSEAAAAACHWCAPGNAVRSWRWLPAVRSRR